ncbi:MAG: RNA 2'-phosphotransferase, partial [Salinibacter sp.]
MDDRLRRTSKFLSYVLRHDPDALGLELDPGGWVEVEPLIERARADGRSLSRARIEQVIEAGEKTRFALSDDGSRIRANYGHSIEVDLALSSTPPPGTLYHGTARAALSAIRAEGVLPQSRQYVHLSSTPDEAAAVGRRHGSPVVVSVDAPALHEAGHPLYRSTEAVWLTRRVPPDFIRVPG